MPDNLTTPRQLQQIHWENGITDGDIRPGFMKELLNVEMDEGGRLRCRDGVVSHDVHIPTPLPSKFIHINGDPSALRPNGWNIFITSGTVFVYPYGYDMNEVDAGEIALSLYVDISTIESIVLGSTLILSSKDAAGLPNPVISIVWNSSTGKFSPPEYVVDGDDVYGQIDLDGSWGVHEFNRIAELDVYTTEITGTDKKNVRRSALVELDNFISEDPVGRVGLFVTSRKKDTISTESMGYTDKAIMQVVAVMIFNDGSSSLPSEVKDINIDYNDATVEFDVGFSLMVHKDLFGSVKGIRIYRKIIEGITPVSEQFDFLFYAPLFDEDIHEDTLKTPAFTDGNRDLVKHDYGRALLEEEGCDNYIYNNHEEDYGLQVKVNTPDFLQNTIDMSDRVAYSHEMGVTMSKTAGWIKCHVDSDIMLYMPEHFYQLGQLYSKFRQMNVNPDGEVGGLGIWFKIYHGGGNIRITDRNLVGQNFNELITINNFEFTQSMIIGSHISPAIKYTGKYLLSTIEYKFPNTNADGNLDPTTYDFDLIGYRGMFRLTQPNWALSSFGYDKPAWWSNGSLSVDPYADDDLEGFGLTFAAFRDKADIQNVPSLENEYGGVNADDIASVKPRHIGAAGGRLFALNIIEDDLEQPSKMMYSEIGNYAVFRKDNYIDYGVRDDGFGIAISNLKSYVIAHHSASTYIFDIAGGSDFTWREVAAFKSVGCLGFYLVAITPFGVFWCDKKHVWYYNGGQPQPITKEIMRTYREMVPNLSRLIYKEDLKQIWLTSNNDTPIYVFDIEGGRWHTHNLTEFGINNKLIDSMFNVADDIFIDTSETGTTSEEDFSTEEGQFSNHAFFDITEASLSPFTWLIDTGEMDFGSPEIVKKIRRMYIHMVRYAGYNDVDRQVKIEAIGSTSGDITIDDDLVINDKQIRVSTSVRGYHVTFRVSVESSTFWRGKMESLGVSFKPKKLK